MDARGVRRFTFVSLCLLLLPVALPSAQTQWETTDRGIVIAARIKASPSTLREREAVSLLVICKRDVAPAEIQVSLTTSNVGVLLDKGAAYQVVGETTASPMRPLPIIADGPTAHSVRIAPAVVWTFLSELAGATWLRVQVTDVSGQLRLLVFSRSDSNWLPTNTALCSG